MIVFLLLSATSMALGQVKVTTSGNVEIGASTTKVGKFKTAYNGAEFLFHTNEKTDGKSYFGSYNTKDSFINFYHPKEGYNKIRFKAYLLSSDTAFKTSIAPLESTTAILRQINTYSYYFKSDVDRYEEYLELLDHDENTEDDRHGAGSDTTFLNTSYNYILKKEYGVLAHEVQSILPDLVDTCNNQMFVDYNSFIAILIKGFNEQQDLIENLQSTVSAQEISIAQLSISLGSLQRTVSACCGNNGGGNGGGREPLPNQQDDTDYYDDAFFKQGDVQGDTQHSLERASLFQNAPNPFSSNTVISCNLPETTQRAVIYIYSLQGVELKSYPLTQKGLNSITVYGSELSAGMYLYTLVVDNEIIDTKRMILTK